MAHDDMHMVAFRILAYLQVCMREGKKPVEDEFSHEALGIGYPYWADVVYELQEKGYVKGFVFQGEFSGGLLVIPDAPRITLDGASFLKENSAMKKALKAAQEVKKALPLI